MDTINNRIKIIIESHFGGNKTAFSEAVGISTSVVDNLVGKRQSRPSFEVLQKIAELPNVPLDWLVHGEKRGKNSSNSISNIAGGDNNISAPQLINSVIDTSTKEILNDKSMMIGHLMAENRALNSTLEEKEQRIKEKDERIAELTNRLLECLKG